MKMFKKLALKMALAIVFFVNCSLAQSKNYAPFVKIEAEDYSAIANARTANDCGNPNEYHVGRISSSSSIRYDKVNFEKGAKGINIRMSGYRPDHAKGKIIVRVDSPTGRTIASIPVGSTNAHCQYATVSSSLSKPIAGLHRLYFFFEFVPPKGTAPYFVDIDWFNFIRA